MHTLFNERVSSDRGQNLFPEFTYVKRGMLQERDKVITFYRNQVFNVESSHLLVRLIQSMQLQTYDNYQRFVDTAKDQSARVSMSLRLTSPIYLGGLRSESIFYGPNVKEVLMATEEDFDVEAGAVEWRDLKPIRVLSHPFADIAMPLLKGHYPSTQKGITVIAINIPMLMLQYRRWVEEVKYNSGDIASRTIMQFVAMYPIPNMLYSHLDVAIFNRLAVIQRKETPVDIRNPHPFAVVDYSQRLDHILTGMTKSLENRAFTFDQILKNIPMLSAIDLFEVMVLPRGPKTRQVVWARILARLPLVKFLLRINADSDSYQNQYYMTRIAIGLREMKSDGWLMQAMSPDERMDIEQDISKTVMALL